MSCNGSERYFNECAHEVSANGDCSNAAILCGKSSSKRLQYYPHLWELFVKFYNNCLLSFITTIIDQPRCVSAGVPNPPDFSGYNRLNTTTNKHYRMSRCLLYRNALLERFSSARKHGLLTRSRGYSNHVAVRSEACLRLDGAVAQHACLRYGS